MMGSQRPKKSRKSTEKTAGKKFTYPALEDRIRVSMKMQIQNSLAREALASKSMGFCSTPFSPFHSTPDLRCDCWSSTFNPILPATNPLLPDLCPKT
jgi:hypothetical protein